MKILMIGSGVIGTIYGWAFSQAGHDVTHLIRNNKMDSLQKGIAMDILDFRKTHEPSVSDQLSSALLNPPVQNFKELLEESTKQQPNAHNTVYYPKLITTLTTDNKFELVIVPTKHYQLIETLKQIYPYLHQAQFLLFCARWDDLVDVDSIIPRTKYLLGYPASSGGYDKDTMVVNIRQDYRIGDYDGTHAELLQKIIKLFASAGFVADIKENMLEWLWVHHAINAGTIGSLLYAGGFDALVDSNFATLFHSATLEAIEVLKKRGLDITRYPDVDMFLKHTSEQVLEFYQKIFIETPIGQRTLRAGHHKHSMAEMRQYYLDVLNTGKLLRVDMPTLYSYEKKINGDFE